MNPVGRIDFSGGTSLEVQLASKPDGRELVQLAIHGSETAELTFGEARGLAERLTVITDRQKWEAS